ncbi:NAD(P)H-quinone oxidoreductase [Brevibacillus sp. SYP-B805]|nr:NAD(P)H-quinone oxidoreductase [Brevibacillus sp. SYP-B805]NGQ96609.1 NAD(P)H-quinone oxidoreductase [Brevibacillus sp. SYP-B805]
MKAVFVEEGTKRLFIGETDQPAMGDDELLIDVKATALNRADLLQKRGLYPPPAGASPILGLEMAGVVSAVGKAVTGWKEGDRVCALLPGGGYAERVVIPAQMAMPIPENLSFEEAAAIPEVFLTAYLNLFWLGGLQSGQTVLIHAGASGVGTAAIQLAREAGARVIVTAGSEAKRQTCLELGADLAIDYRTGPFADRVKEATAGRGVPLILDLVGASYWEQNLDCLADQGKMILIGTMGGGKVPNVNLGLLLARRLHIIGSALRTRSVQDKIALTQEFAPFALPRFADGRLKPVIDSVYDWQEVNEAHARMEGNQNTGKIVLRISR